RMGNVMRGMSTESKVNTENLDASLKEEDMVVVLQDYPSPEISEPIYRMGEKLKVVAQEANWWRVRSLQTGKENYIPGSHIARVYHGWLFEGVERQKAEELLLLPVNRVGSFLVRESTRERGLYSLSVRHRSIKHYRIFRLDNSWYYISPRLTFQCLEDMINHYSDSADGLCCVLTSPCLSGTSQPPDASLGAPPVVMRHKETFSYEESCNDNVVSYGVRNSIAAYLSFAGDQDPSRMKSDNRKKKSKSLYVVPEHGLPNTDYDEDF
uniref:Src-like-adapter n=1 Tax=Amphilophus citrinellus TaxID=61819 RepID=A0A3Q0SD99_AMPCI